MMSINTPENGEMAETISLFTDCSYDATGNPVCVYRGLPFQFTQAETPDELVALMADVEAGRVTIAAYTPPPPPPPPTPEEILALNTAEKTKLMSHATAEIAPLQDAVDIGEATSAEEALLLLWKKYRVAVNRVDLALADPVWPQLPA